MLKIAFASRQALFFCHRTALLAHNRLTSAVTIFRFVEVFIVQKIHFYSVNDDYGSFSNFAPYSVRIKGKLWPTTEHFFQAQKFAGQPDEEKIRKAKTPVLAAQMGRDRRRPLRRDWDSVKISIMREALWAKFTQHQELRVELASTKDACLVEHTENDDYWGDGGDGKGKNMLGILLMELRAKLSAP
ncbi:NADAR family protein [Paraherbaspirillum soli]|uniref:NADAR family protein n=1 Tax=Paraherbaspirillum soli TaxID=631222 RepID=A0ABW0MAU7_9BURK